MRRMSKFAGLLDKYGNVEEDTKRQLGKINWDGHIKIRGTFHGAAFGTNYEHSFFSTDLISDKNPRGSILMEARNYTDSKTKALYYHCVTLVGTAGSVYVTYISDYADKYTIATLKTALAGKTLVCGGYLGGVAEYISGEAGGLLVGIVDVTDGSTSGTNIDNTFSISDKVTPI